MPSQRRGEALPQERRMENEDHQERTERERRSKAKGRVPAARDEGAHKAQGKARDRCCEKGLDHTDRPDEGSNHCQKLHVAEAEAGKPRPVVEAPRARKCGALSGPVLEGPAESRREARVGEAYAPQNAAAEQSAPKRTQERGEVRSPVECFDHGHKEKACCEAPHGDFIGDDAMLRVDGRRGHEQGGKYTPESSVDPGSCLERNCPKEHCSEQFDGRIPQRDRCPTASTLPTQKEIGHKRDVLIRTDGP